MEIYKFYLGNHLCSVLSSIFDFFFPFYHLYWNSNVHQENVYFVLLRTRYLRSPQSSKETDQTQNYMFKILCDQIYHLCMQRPWGWQSGMEGCVCSPCGRRRRRHVEKKSYRQRIWATSWKWDGGDTLLRWLCLLLFAFNVLEGSSSSRSWWCMGKPGMLRPLGSQRVRHDWATEPNWTEGSSRTDLWGGWVVTENTEAQVILMFWGLIIDSQLLQKSLCASSVTQGWRPAFASRFVSKWNLWLRNPSR